METQADKVGKWLSDFVRGLLIKRLLGAEIWREPLPAFAAEDLRNEAEWESGTD